MVKALAGNLHARLPLNCGVEVADLIQAGNVGLLKAVKVFDIEVGAPLLGYAKFRIRGEMLDLVRRHIGRGGNTRVTAEQHAEENVPASPESSPQSPLLFSQRVQILQTEIGKLPAKYQAVVRLRYSGEMTHRQIGEELKVNESRACQLHTKALSRLKKALRSRGVSDFTHL